VSLLYNLLQIKTINMTWANIFFLAKDYFFVFSTSYPNNTCPENAKVF
jgi:uncharacterized membrane protein required for colicin V production